MPDPGRHRFFSSPHRACRVELFQFFSDDQTLRDSLKQSTGVEDPSASKR